MKNKIIYETQWVARDESKEYPHGWGFVPPLIEFPQDIDPAYAAKVCMEELSNEEFECIGAIPRNCINSAFIHNYEKIKDTGM